MTYLEEKNLRKDLIISIETALKEIDFQNYPSSLYEPYRYAMSVGGKRIRPLLTLLACGMNGGSTEKALAAALAVEILHNFTLVHDDIMDSADTRRGKPSVFKKWDENVAILGGDLMFAEAYRFLNFYGQKEEYSKLDYFQMNLSFNQAIIAVCEGQAYDMEFISRTKVSQNEYIKMIAGKTGALIAAALKMGGIAARAPNEAQDMLHNLGMEMGIAFQIQDDLLDATADPKKFGKKSGGDIIEGKKTYLTILALERADNIQQEIITRVLEDSEATHTDINEVLNIMRSLNVISDVNKIVQHHYENCYSFIESFKSSNYRQELKNLLIFLQKRDH